MRAAIVLLVVAAVALAGCQARSTPLHQQGVQCEAMPWDGDDPGGDDPVRAERLRTHYEALGFAVMAASVYRYDVATPSVCGAWDGRVYEIVLDGDDLLPQGDGWTPGYAPTENRL